MSDDAPEFDFGSDAERELQERWARNERAIRDEWTEENLCVAWIVSETKVSSAHWREWFAALPGYERRRLLIAYQGERERADYLGCAMRPYNAVMPTEGAIREGMRQDREIIEVMKTEIKEAALAGQGLPRRESEDMGYIDRLTFRHRQETAMRELGVVLIKPAEPLPVK